jgi:hypothetical protein
MSNRNRAVSEVVATLVILLIISILGTSIYSFSLTTVRSQQDRLRSEISKEVSRTRERLKIVYVHWNGLGDRLNITFLNYGLLEANIVKIYVDGEMVTTYHEGLEVHIPDSELGLISFTSPVEISPDELYDIVFVTGRGVSNVHTWQS